MAQKTVDWAKLGEVRFVERIDLSSGYLIEKPRFSKAIKALEGKTIEISGYILPLSMADDVYVLSRFPYAACFFCGGAGLESVMRIWFKDRGNSYRMDQYVRLRGVLTLSDSGEGLIYLLEKAEEVR